MYAYTSISNCLEVQDIDDVKDYHDTIVSNNFVSLTTLIVTVERHGYHWSVCR